MTRARLAWLLSGIATLVWMLATPAFAADQSTIDPQPDSFGPVVTDGAGNGYVAWEHAGAGAGADVPMFCKLAAGTPRCEHSIALGLPNSNMGAEANALAPFPILGPGRIVWVVASRYVLDDTLIWTSSDGGQSFGGPHEIPYQPSPVCDPSTNICHESYSYSDLTNADDSLPVTLSYATYNRQLYSPSGPPAVFWLESSFNSGLGFNLDGTNETAGGYPGASEFTFGNTGAGSVDGSALGTTSVGDVVEAYWLLTTPPTLAFYSFHAAGHTPITPQNAWSGPTVLGDGYLPRMAQGAGGLYLLSDDAAHAGGQPTLVQIRRYSTVTHAFGPARTIAVTPTGATELFSGGGLGENYDSGQLAAVWPRFGSTSQLNLYLSGDGAHFSPAQPIATVGDAYAIDDNARIAIADNGTGFVTFRDARGLQIADLYPLGTQYGTLHRTGKVVNVVFTCPAPKGRCTVTVKLTRRHAGKLATGRFMIPAGTSRKLKLHLSPAVIALLHSRHGRLSATLVLTVRLAGAPSHSTTAPVTIHG